MTNFEKVQEFYNTFNQISEPTRVVTPSPEKISLRLKLIREELEEINQELNKDKIDHQKLAKEIADLLYVAYGFGSAFGYPMDEVFAEVHASNMSKLGPDGKPIYREDGKIIKGPNYRVADLSSIVKE